MKVQDVMTRSPATCFIQDPLHLAAQKLWERDCGCLPVIDSDAKPLAMITDRDICMAAFTTGKPLHELQVGQAMSQQVVSCRDGDDLAAAGARMAQHGVRRVPVVDSNGCLCGVLSLNDLALTAAKEAGVRTGGTTSEALRVLFAVSAHRKDDGQQAPQSSGASQTSAAGATQQPGQKAAQASPLRDQRVGTAGGAGASRMASSSGESAASASA